VIAVPLPLRSILALIAVFGCGLDHAAARGKSKDPRAIERRLIEGMQREPLIFFVAKGGPNACGPGCSTWIAAEGKFDDAASTRFSAFMAEQPRDHLPIFFSSTGGLTNHAMAIGEELRKRRMTAGIGRTLPEGCRDADRVTEQCRRVMRSKSEHRARLVVGNVRCLSACGIALLGASNRAIAPGAQLGIHAVRLRIQTDPTKKPRTIQQVADQLKRYALQMGVSAELVDEMFKVSADRMRIMNSAEIVRLGVTTRDFHETRWTAYQHNAGSHAILKSWTRAQPGGAGQHRTTFIMLSCAYARGSIPLLYRREFGVGEAGVVPTVSVAHWKPMLTTPAAATSDANSTTNFISVDFEGLKSVAAASSIEVTETFSLGPTRRFWISTAGLRDALAELEKRCSWGSGVQQTQGPAAPVAAAPIPVRWLPAPYGPKEFGR
jgi:hypothetical protein